MVTSRNISLLAADPSAVPYSGLILRGDFQALFARRRVPETGPLKAAVVGAGVFGHHHATKYKSLGLAHKQVELFAIADPNPDMRAKAKAHHGCAVVADYRELLGK